MSTQSTEVVSSSVAGDSSSFNNAGVSVSSSLERKMELLEERFTRRSSNAAASPETILSIHSSATSSHSEKSHHSFSFDLPTASRSSSVGIDSNLSTASNLPSSSIRSRRRPSRSNSLRAVSMAAEKQMQKVRTTSVTSPLMSIRAASPHLPFMVQEQERSQSMSNLPSPSMSNASGYSNQTMQTSHRAKRTAPPQAAAQVVAESPPTLLSPKPGRNTTNKGQATAPTKDNASSMPRSVLGTQKTDKRKSVPMKRPAPSVTDKKSTLLSSKSSPAVAENGRKRGRLSDGPRMFISPKGHQNSLDGHSRDPSNSAKGSSKSKPPKNNTLINDFFASAVKKPKAAEKMEAPPPAAVAAKPVTASRPRILSSLDDTSSSSKDGVATRSTSSSRELDRMRSKLEQLQQSYNDKDEQLKAVANNQTIMHTAIKAALSQREKELEEVKAASERKAAITARAVETLVRAESATEARELREKLALNCARLGRIVYTRAGMRAVESWEDGYASKNLRKRRAELRAKRDTLEKRRDAARAAAEAVRDNKENQDSSGTRVGGLLVDDELAAMEALESVRLHLATIKQEEADLAEEERALHTEKGIHIRSLKRVASEDASRFKSRPKLHGRYVLVTLLGKGGFSEVWQAYDLVELREVAVKIHQLDPRWSDAKKENYTKHVSREYEIHRDVRHPRIVSLYDVFEIDNNSFATVLELCKGTDLDALLKEKKRLPERDARAILLQILCGMRYLSLPSSDGSRQGIIHYDLKPGNILFDEFGDAKITDFGLSKIVENDPADSMELTSQGAGTYWYLPPECFVTNQSVRISNKVDVFSIGVIYYQMLFGRRPFGDGQSQDKVLSNLTMLNAREVRFPSGIQVSDECKEFIQQCLTYDQAFRPTIGQLCQSPYLMKKKI